MHFLSFRTAAPVVSFLWFCFAAPVWSDAQAEILPGEKYAVELIERARALDLAHSEQWRALLHYETSLWSGRRSTADDTAFFTDPNGKSDPDAELASTVRAFFMEPANKPDEHPQCRFPARYSWLKTMLGFDPRRLPERSCTAFQAWKQGLDAAGVTLVYPAAHLNNPATSFGHTFARIDAKGQDDRTRLLAYSANYAALTTETQGLLYAFRGIFGLYQGGFTIDPYYLQVRRYSDIESRDIWEYRLNLNQAEVDRLIEHLWELGPTRFDYYFFDENCSYQLLTLFDAARPELDLAGKFRLWAIPVDTIRAVIEPSGMLAGAEYRPSVGSIVRTQTAVTRPEIWQTAARLAEEPLGGTAGLSSLSAEDQAAAVELAANYVNYLMMKAGSEGARENRKLYELTKLRSAIAAPPALPLPERPKVRPDEGHSTARIETSAGARDGRLFYGLSYRPAYHDLLDPEPGFERGAAIDFFETRFRHYEGEGVRLEQFTPLSIISVAPQDFFIAPVSWRVTSELSRRELEAREAAVYQNSVGAGVGAELGRSGLAYFFVNGIHEQSRGYAGDYSIGWGPSGGVFLDLNERTRAGLTGAETFFAIGAEHRRHEGEFALRRTVGRNSAARLALRARGDYSDTTFEAEFSWDVYF